MSALGTGQSDVTIEQSKALVVDALWSGIRMVFFR